MTFTPASDSPTADVEERTFCAVHPTVETALRCNKCGRYMCTKCSVQTPVGYRCKQCVYQQQEVFYTANQMDYVIAAGVGAAISVVAAPILTQIGLFLIIILGLPLGAGIGEIIFRATGRRRGRYTWAFAAGGIVIGGLISMLVFNPLLRELVLHPGAITTRDAGVVGLFLIEPVLYIVLVAGAAIARLR